MKIHFPLISPWYQIYIEGTECIFKHGHTVTVLEGEAVNKVLSKILPFLDGKHSIETIISQFAEIFHEPIKNVLNVLEEKGILVEGTDFLDEHISKIQQDTLLFLQQEGSEDTLPSLSNKLAEVKIGIIGNSPLAHSLKKNLNMNGVNVYMIENPLEEDVSAFSSVVFCGDNDTYPYIKKWNEKTSEEGIKWFYLAAYDGEVMQIGPMFHTPDTACFACMKIRNISTISYQDEYERWEEAKKNGKVSPHFSKSPYQYNEIASNMLAIHLLKTALDIIDGGLLNEYYTLSMDTFEGMDLTKHRLLKVPRCPVCSKLSKQSQLLPWYEVNQNA